MAKKKRRVKRKIYVILVLIGVLLVFAFCGIGSFLSKFNIKTVETVDTISKFDYSLSDENSKYYKSLFKELKQLVSTDYDECDYAVLVCKLFLTDFYDLNSKKMKSDIGGVQYVYESYRDDFILGAMNSLYKFVQSDIYGDRKQDLPIVKAVDLVDVKRHSFNSGDFNDLNAYYFDMKIKYNKNYGYPSDVSVVLIHNGDKLEVASLDIK